MGDYMKDNLSGEKIGFTQGVVYAVALCIKNFCEGSAELIWKESNFNFSDLSVCDDYDSKVVLKYFKKFAKESVIEADAEKAKWWERHLTRHLSGRSESCVWCADAPIKDDGRLFCHRCGRKLPAA